MDEKLFDNWNFIYENSDDISIHVEMFRKGDAEPRLSVDVPAEKLKAKINSQKAFHIELDGCFEVVIHAIKDNLVYMTLLERTSEYGWRHTAKQVLSKRMPRFGTNLTYFGKDHGAILVCVNEWGKLKHDTVL